MPKTDSLEAVVLAALQSDSPTGARTIWRQVLLHGFDVSESTVSRILNELDARGLTSALNNKGRTLTAQGRKLVEDTRVEEQRRLRFDSARLIRTPDELLDLLHVRRGVELVAVRAAAERATPAEIARLRLLASGAENTAQPEAWFEPISFHKYVGHVSHSKPVQAITDALFEDKFDPQERVIYLIGRASGTWIHSGPEHELIAEAIADRNPSAAEGHMLMHLDGIIRTIEEYTRRTSKDVLDQLFAQAGEPGHINK